MRVFRRIQKRALFDVRDVRSHTHHGLQRNLRTAGFCFFDKMREHFFGAFEIGDDAAAQRSLTTISRPSRPRIS